MVISIRSPVLVVSTVRYASQVRPLTSIEPAGWAIRSRSPTESPLYGAATGRTRLAYKDAYGEFAGIAVGSIVSHRFGSASGVAPGTFVPRAWMVVPMAMNSATG